MNQMIVSVRDKMLRRIGGVNHFVTHNKDYEIQFQFDDSWADVRHKMAVFAYEDGEYGSEIFDGDTCNVPELPREGRILIGVKAGEDLSTELLCIPVCKSADDVITDEYDEPDPKIYEQILDIINNLWNGGTTVYPSPVKFLASPSAAKVGDLIRVKEVDENGDVTRTEGFDIGVELEKKIDAPQTAAVGEVLTVEEVDAEGKPKKWKTQAMDVADVVKFTKQDLTDEEQKQARKNIGAKPVDFPVTITSTTIDGVTTYTADKTFAEIKVAYENGANVYAEGVPYAGNAIPLTLCLGSAKIVFSGITDINRVYCITINKNNNISVVSGRTGAPLYSWSELPLVMQNPPFVISVSDDKAPDGGGLLYYTYGKSDRIIEYDMITRTGNYYKVFTNRQNNEIILSLRGQFVPAVTTSDNGKILQVANGTWTKTDLPVSLPIPATAQVGQIVKVKAVDESGKITETEAIPHPVLYVTISKTGNTNTSDKTFAEIKSAYDSGCSVFAVVDSFVLPLLAVLDNMACFCATTPDGELHRVSVLITESSVSLGYGSFVEGNQGVENAGKILGIGNDGNVVPQDKPVQSLAGAAAPTTATAGVVGQEYYVIADGAVNEMYVCTAVANGTYTWDKVEFGGGSYTAGDGIKIENGEISLNLAAWTGGSY